MRLTKLHVGLTAFLAYIVIILAGVAGWIMNLIAIVDSINAPMTAKLVIRIVGIFVPPLGAIMGYIS